MFELMDAYSQSAVIKVVGVGGGGGNAVKHMATCGIDGVDFICANTDRQALLNANVKTTLQIGCNITKGLGAGANPEVGYQAAMEDRDRLQELIEGADMLFITAGLGGGTGTGAAPVEFTNRLGMMCLDDPAKLMPQMLKRRTPYGQLMPSGSLLPPLQDKDLLRDSDISETWKAWWQQAQSADFYAEDNIMAFPSELS